MIKNMQAKESRVTSTGLKALSKSPGDRSAIERRQAKQAERALRDKKKQEKHKENAEKKRLQDGLKPYNKAASKLTGIKRLAYRVKVFWLIEGSRPKRFYPVSHPINLEVYDFLKQATIELADKCLQDYEYGERAVSIWTLLENPPVKAKRVNIAATCRVFADFVLDKER